MATPIAATFMHQGKKLILVTLILVALPSLYYGISIGQDWIQVFRPTTLALLQGRNVYSGFGFYNAPWTLIPFIPFALMPYRIGRVCFFLLSLACFFYIPYKLGAKPISVILFITSYPVISCLNGGGIEWLPMLSFVTPTPVSLIFAAMKPQVGIGLGLYWLFESWQTGGVRLVIKNFLPVAILLGISFVIYGLWVTSFAGMSENPVNISLFPYSVFVGLYLLWVAIMKRRANPAMAASPFLAPYHTVFSLAVPLVALLEHPKLLAFVSICLWGLGVVRAWVYW